MGVRKASYLVIAAFVMAVSLAMVGCSAGASSSGTSSTAVDSASSASGSAEDSSGSAASASSTATVPGAPRADAVLAEDEWGDFFQTRGEGAVEFGRRVQDDLPVRAVALWAGEGGGSPIEFTDPAEIRALFNALAASNVAGETTTFTTDDYSSFGFEFADGTSCAFYFDSLAFDVGTGDGHLFYDLDPSPDLNTFLQLAYKKSMGEDL